MNDNLEKLTTAMQQKDFYPHSVSAIQHIETHISILFLTGNIVYKIKKPVDFGFLDFTKLSDRQHYCEEELRINRRTAPSLYLDVVPLYAHSQGYSLTPLSEHDVIIEYAVKMQQFDTQQQFDVLLDQQAISLQDIEDLATEIANFHRCAECAALDTPWGTPDLLLDPCLENLDLLASDNHVHQAAIQNLRKWSQHSAKILSPVFTDRKKTKVRECHGDMHLANIARIDNKLTLFDALEFSEKLRWIDVASDLAFLLMDLESHNHIFFSNHLLNHYLSITGDYELIQVLRFYKVYRALVRAKVAHLQQQNELTANYLSLANRYTQKHAPTLFITFGLSGSGKSWGSSKIADQFGLIHIRSDIERKRLAGMLATDREQTAFGEGLYSQAMSNKTYDELARIATLLLQNAQSIIVDATFLKRGERNAFANVAEAQNAGFAILHFDTEIEQLEKNILTRGQRNDDASDADIAVLRKQLTVYDKLGKDENVITLLFAKALPATQIAQQLNRD
ncbi:MAG: Unknown protein [uncultured Thiotrichaceae bacterium]|uniref:Aminoglycoside phosphotransferase domain-containing protein n=1 Tax=uncultured Thiotrichaceae bacterium TaxID=298394 RepID=A0A6S6T9X4_9GAMM|nr:MAG: Unknown protein [uncultured Thiotrichaceae bacterium]